MDVANRDEKLHLSKLRRETADSSSAVTISSIPVDFRVSRFTADHIAADHGCAILVSRSARYITGDTERFLTVEATDTHGEWYPPEVTMLTGGAVPSRHDDQAWTALAAQHNVDCEWITTRAHRTGDPRYTRRRKPRIGRPPLGAAKLRILGVRIPAEVKTRIAARAKAERTTSSAWCAEVIEQALGE